MGRQRPTKETEFRRFDAFLIGSLTTALLLGALAAPAAAADTKGTLAIVNGIPGTRIDICLNGRELASKVPYGGKILRNVVKTGAKSLKVYKPDPRTCRGTLLGKRGFGLGPGDDLTIVATRKAPKLVIFDNPAFLGEIPPLGTPRLDSPLILRHAAEFPATFKYFVWYEGNETPISPSADPVWTEGDEVPYLTGLPGDRWFVRVVKPDTSRSLASLLVVVSTVVGDAHRYEWILVGTKLANARLVLIDRPISNLSP